MIIRKVTIIMFVLNASVTFLGQAGSKAVWGVEMTTGVDNIAESVNKTAKQVESPIGIVEAIAGLTVAAIKLLNGLLDIVFAAPLLLQNLGVPTWITGFVFAPLYLVVAIDIIAILRGDSGI